ncbi:MAG: hypothetical protein AAGC44_00120 [Planctomycetota bacterium]
MQTLELECPSCGDLLELDVGFAGGVCRCSSCGTLMTVPDEAGSGPETLTRPDRPDDPGSISTLSASDLLPADDARPESPTSAPPSRDKPGRTARSKAGGRTSRRSGRARGKGKKKGKGKTLAEPIEAGEYQTASGKTIRIDRTTKVPTARQRKTARIATAAIMIGVTLAIGVTFVVLAIVFLKPPDDSDLEAERLAETAAREALNPAFIYRPSANPLNLVDQNILGLPPTPPTAVIYQADTQNQRWVEDFATLLGGGMSKPENPRPIALFAVGASGVRSYGKGPTDSHKASAVSSFISGLDTTDGPELAPAIRQALNIEPHAMVLIVSNAASNDFEAWSKALADRGDLVVHILLIEDFSSSLRQWHNKHSNGGKFESLVREDLSGWVRDAD